jgi:hypothetical protein
MLVILFHLRPTKPSSSLLEFRKRFCLLIFSRPKNGAIFAQGQVIRLEFPAQGMYLFFQQLFLGYVNPLNTTLSFDVTLYSPVASSTGPLYTNTTRFQNNVSFVLN